MSKQQQVFRVCTIGSNFLHQTVVLCGVVVTSGWRACAPGAFDTELKLVLTVATSEGAKVFMFARAISERCR